MLIWRLFEIFLLIKTSSQGLFLLQMTRKTKGFGPEARETKKLLASEQAPLFGVSCASIWVVELRLQASGASEEKGGEEKPPFGFAGWQTWLHYQDTCAQYPKQVSPLCEPALRLKS